MECDMPSAGGSTEMLAAAVSLADDGEPVVIGSESWHSQVPAVSFIIIFKCTMNFLL